MSRGFKISNHIQYFSIKPTSHSYAYSLYIRSNSLSFNTNHPKISIKIMSKSSLIPMNCTKNEVLGEPIMINPHEIDPNLLNNLIYDALVWSSLHGLVVGHRNFEVCFLYWTFPCQEMMIHVFRLFVYV